MPDLQPSKWQNQVKIHDPGSSADVKGKGYIVYVKGKFCAKKEIVSNKNIKGGWMIPRGTKQVHL